MPKQKTHSGIKKRVRVTGGGKLLHAGSGKRHNLEKKSTRYTRRVDGMHPVADSDVRRVRRMLGI